MDTMTAVETVETVEAAARELYDLEWFRKQEVWATSWERASPALREECRDVARRVLAAASITTEKP